MDRKKDISQIFKDRLGDMKESPREDLWNAIASEIDKSSRRRIAPLWFYAGGTLLVAITIALFAWQPWTSSSDTQEFFTSTSSQNSKNTQNNTPKSVMSVDVKDDNSKLEQDNGQNTQNNIKNNNSGKTYDTNTLSDKTGNNINQNYVNRPSNKPTIAQNNTISNTNTQNLEVSNFPLKTKKATTTYSNNTVLQNPNPTIDSPREIKARALYEAKIAKELQDAIAAQHSQNEKIYQIQLEREAIAAVQKAKEKQIEKEKQQVTLNESKTKKSPKTDEERALDRKAATEYKVAISPYTSLLSYGSLARGSSIDDRLVNNPRESISTVGYGLRADIPLSEKTSIRVGIGVAPLRYRTDNFQVSSVNGNINIFELSALSAQDINQPGIETTVEAQNFFQQNTVVSIEQDISYLEVPVDYQYRLLNKRIGLSINSGLSLFVLTDNSVFATAESGSTILIGRETDLKDLSIAFNLGLGVHYNFSKNWRFNAEPAFKYQFNPYTNRNTNFRPYYIGIQFGLSHKF